MDCHEWRIDQTGKGGRATAPSRPSSLAGGHDPLLEWALRESRSGIAAFLDGALDGLRRAAEMIASLPGSHPEREKTRGMSGGHESFVINPSCSSNGEAHARLMYRTEPGRSIDSLAARADCVFSRASGGR